MKRGYKNVVVAVLASVMLIGSSSNAYALTTEHIINGYEINEPIFVHTPVISPVSITDEEGNVITGGGHGTTQLISENPNAWYELRLDEGYVMHWDSLVHRQILGYGDSEDNPSKYDKYTKDKWMKLPFEVYYDGKFYELRADNYTDWIKIKKPSNWTDAGIISSNSLGLTESNNHWINTPIYIPSYAREMGESGNEGSIFYKVEAINVDGDLAEHFEEQEAEGNIWNQFVLADDGAKYVATYEIPVQLSGWVYDFTVTGTDNGAIYQGENEMGSNAISFASTKSEKKSGTKNRLGESNLRYLLDGSLEQDWNSKNTITLTDGKSAQFTKLGAAWKGQTFSFEVKTIANLWDDDGNSDRIEIVPTFTYVDVNGNRVEQSNLALYYNNPDGSGSYIEYGSLRDTISSNWSRSIMGSPMQEGAYYTNKMADTYNGGSARQYHFGDWAKFTAQVYNANHGLTGSSALTEENILNRSSSSYCLSRIILNPKLRLLSGEWESLSLNIKGSGNEFESVKRYEDMDEDGAPDATWDASDTLRFRKSMQTWYGQYYVPSDLYVVDLNKHPGFDIESYMNSANSGLGIREDDPVFEQSGYLIINFDIRTYNDSQAHLRYAGGSSGGNMWAKEGFNNSPDSSDPTPITYFNDGDVIVIDLSKSVKDKYRAGIFDVN